MDASFDIGLSELGKSSVFDKKVVETMPDSVR